MDYSVLIMTATKMVLPGLLKSRLSGPTGFLMKIVESGNELLVRLETEKVIRSMHDMVEMIFACNY